MKMPFGCHKGTELADLPDDYFDWLFGLPDLYLGLRRAVDAEAARRDEAPEEHHEHASRPRRGAEDALVEPAREIVKEGLHALALRHHPDHGGNVRTMQEINAAADMLRTLLERSA